MKKIPSGAEYGVFTPFWGQKSCLLCSWNPPKNLFEILRQNKVVWFNKAGNSEYFEKAPTDPKVPYFATSSVQKLRYFVLRIHYIDFFDILQNDWIL